MRTAFSLARWVGVDAGNTIDGVTVDPDGAVPWRAFYEEARARLEAVGGEFAAVDARRIVEEASGAEPGEFAQALERYATERGVAHFDRMLERRLVGEPLQYVLGRWAFRTLDLAVDARVLIPRPEIDDTFGRARGWLEEHGAEQPFFLLIHTYEPHTPYVRTKYLEGLDAILGYRVGRQLLQSIHQPERDGQ